MEIGLKDSNANLKNTNVSPQQNIVNTNPAYTNEVLFPISKILDTKVINYIMALNLF